MHDEDFYADLIEVLFVERDELTDDTDLMDLGLTSMSVVTLLDRFNKRGADLDFGRLAANTTVAQWRSLVIGR